MMCCCGKIATGGSDVIFLCRWDKRKKDQKHEKEAVQVNSIPLHSGLCLLEQTKRRRRGLNKTQMRSTPDEVSMTMRMRTNRRTPQRPPPWDRKKLSFPFFFLFFFSLLACYLLFFFFSSPGFFCLLSSRELHGNYSFLHSSTYGETNAIYPDRTSADVCSN